jgi:peptidoglycan/LPS O-acetylase OafA/YrhL
MSAVRNDIQALRGVAVLLVMLYHAKLSFLPAGYLGVDVFFVISGFLITHQIKGGIERGQFSFQTFYLRRARRLLPAAYVTFLVTGIAAPFLLTSNQLADFANEMLGAVSFTANIVLWQQSGYFGTGAEFKPLMHIWSLAVEEQYYMLVPALLFFIPQRFWRPVTVVGLFASLALCLLAAKRSPDAAFFLLPTRAWELTLGSVGALFTISEPLRKRLSLLAWPALILVVAIPVFPIGGLHPGPDAIVVCLATLVLILAEKRALNRGFLVTWIGKVGDFSYSLYLVHWPLFAFLSNIWAGELNSPPPLSLRLGVLVLSMVLGYSLYRWVEKPLRRAPVSSNGMAMLKLGLGAACVACVAGCLPATVRSSPDYGQITRQNTGFDSACAYGKTFTQDAKCQNSATPEVLVWGDSFAMHLVPGISATSGQLGVIQATRSMCGPLLGLADVSDAQTERYAKVCLSFNQEIVDFLAATPSVKVVIIASPFEYYLDPSHRMLKQDGTHLALSDTSIDQTVWAVENTVQAVRAMGKKIVVVAPPPSSGFDMGKCNERRLRGLPMIGENEKCDIHVDAYRKYREQTLKFLARLHDEADVDVVGFDSYLCDSTRCRTYVDGTFIYRDDGHLSYDGSVLLARQTQLLQRSLAAAR